MHFRTCGSFLRTTRNFLFALFITSQALRAATNMTPVAVTGFNQDVVIENTATGPPFNAYAVEMNAGEGNAFYQAGLAGKLYGLPVSGFFTNAADGSVFKFQPYTANNALILSSDTGISSGTLTLVTPAVYQTIAVIAHSGSADTVGASTLTLNFTDGSSATTNYYAPDWFYNSPYALAGVDRISLATGATQGGPTDPRFYQTTIDVTALTGGNNKPLASILLNQPASARSTAIYAISGFVAPPSPPAFTAQPSSTTVSEATTATFSANAVGNPFPTLQWFLNGAPVPNATNSTFVIPSTPLSDNGAQIKVVASALVSNVNYSVTSGVAVLTVNADKTIPVLAGAQSLGLAQVQLAFSKRMATSGATNTTNYALAGPAGSVAILSAAQDSTQSNVVLSVAALTDGATYVVTVNNLIDQTASGNVIAPNSQATFQAFSYQPAAIGGSGGPGGQVITAGGIVVTGTGASIGGTKDQFEYSYRLVNSNFDVAVRLSALSLSDTWSKAGLVAREDLTPGGRFAASLATPSINGCFFEWRSATNGQASQSGSFPNNFPNAWLRLNRVGNVFSGFASYDGQTWTLLGSQTLAMTNLVYLGFAVDSDQTNQSASAQFQQITNIPANAVVGTIPYPYEPLASCSRTTPIIFSEIMWKPAPRNDTNNCEFIELYNSNPWFHDISYYRIVCADMQYQLPAGTVIPGGGFLVVAASPGSIQNVYGITNVLGPYSGSLKHAETLQLIDEHGSILLTVPYSDAYPWPVAASGSGHSIILANPSYGEGDPRAWSISDQIGGSPGQMESFHPSPLRSVVINEVLAHSENQSAPPFVELYNHSSQTVDLSGCILTDDTAANQFVIPQGTAISAGGFVSFTADSGLTLNPAGDTIYFISPDRNRVLDALPFKAQADGVSCGRWPDGAADFYPLQSRTPGTNNGAILIGNIVINELMYDPISGNDDDQYIELYNQSSNSVNLAGWEFTAGINFKFPPGTVIGPNGYLVVSRNTSELFSRYSNLNPGNTIGNFSGKLSHSGERVALAMPQSLFGTNTIYVVEDEVTYGTGGRWGQWSSGGGSSLELIDPHSNHRLAANWADSNESQKSVWTNIEATGVLDNGHNYETSIAHAQIGMLDVGECLVDNIEADYLGTNFVINSNFESGLGNWSLQGSHVKSSLEPSGYNSSYSLHIRSSDKLWTAENSCEATLAANKMAAGNVATLRFKARWLHGNPEPDLRLNGNWLEATGILPIPSSLGTPGAPNSTLIANAGPAIYEVSHSPAIPAVNQSVVVTARVHDPDGVQNLTLHYRVDPATTYTTVQMKDDGTGGDAIAGDGIFSATIPGKGQNVIVAFFISGADNLAATSRFPALLTDNSPVRECVVMFGDGNQGGSFGAYHFWLTQTNVTRWANLADLSNEGNDFTFVYDNNRIIYNALGHYSGSPFHQSFDSPVGNLCAYKVVFPGDDKFLGATDFNKIHQPGNSPGDDTSLQREQTTYSFMRALGVPWGYRRFVAVYVNGNRRGGNLMEDAQVPDGDMVKQYFPNDTTGSLFKMQPWFEFAPLPSGYSIGETAVSYCYLLQYNTTGGVKKPARYRFNFEIRRTPDSYSDFTNAFSLVDAASSSRSSNFVANLESVADMDEWMRTFAANHAAGNIDSVGTQISQNMYCYTGTKGTKFTMMPWDLNIDLGGPESIGPGQNLLAYDSGDTNLGAIYQTPEFLRMYWRAQETLVNGALNVNLFTGPLMNAKYQAFVNNGLSVENPNTAILPWISSARTSIASQIAAVDTANFVVNTKVTVTNNIATVTGAAPIAIGSVWINGAAWPLTWTSLTNWSVTVPLQTGTNQLAVTAVTTNGQVIAGAGTNLSVVYTNSAPPAAGKVVINEVMYAPAISGASFVELYNNSTNITFDLSGWEIPALGYTFPNGALIRPNSFLVLAGNEDAYARAYGVTNTVFGIYSGAPQPGQLLTLMQPLGASNAVVAQVLFENSLPWPTNVSGSGYSMQLIDPRQDNWRAGNWSSQTANPGRANAVSSSLPPFQTLWINEVEPQNSSGITNSAGQRSPWTEIYNPGTNAVSLNGIALANNYTNLGQSPFPATATIAPGQFLIVFLDGQTNLSTSTELHASFAANPATGSLALSRQYGLQWQVLDYVNYTNLPPDYSLGSVPDGQSFVREVFAHPTPGAANGAAASPPPSFVAYLTPGAVYVQNFDSLPDPGANSVNTANPVTIDGITYSLANPFDFAYPVSVSGEQGGLGLASMAGWYGLADPTASVGTRFGATDGDQTTGGQISFGLPSSSNRALGLLATSTTGYTAFGVRLLNGTSQTLDHIDLQVTGELWRQSDVAKVLEFYYLVDTTGTNRFSTNATAFLPALNVSFATVAADVGGLAADGTAPANQQILAVTNQPITSWPPGAALWLVWEMPSAAGKAQGLAIDNLTFSAASGANPGGPSITAQSSSAGVVLTWPGAVNQSYQLQYKTNLSDAVWIPAGPPIQGTGGPLSVTNDPGNAPQRFYRIAVGP